MLALRSRPLSAPRLASALSNSKRHTSSAPAPPPVELAYDLAAPPDGNTRDQPLVVVHGLFGSKRNWTSLAKAFARELGRPVYTLDLRNHGASPHAPPMTYPAMAADIRAFLARHALSRATLVGHSMGGKAAMATALHPDLPADALAHLVVADIAPMRGHMSGEFAAYVDAMRDIEARGLATRREAQEALAHTEKDESVRAFLLTNFVPATPHARAHFRVPLDILHAAIPDIGDFPYAPGERTWGGPTLVVKGARSKYINHRNIPLFEAFFPTAVLETLEAGHWVQAERPNEFRKLVADFVHANP